MQDKNSTPSQERRRTYKIIGNVLVLIVVLILLILSLRGCGAGDGKTAENMPKNPGIVYDSNAVEGGWEHADVDKIVESLNEKVSEGMINISMNTAPVFEHGRAEGNLMIVNEDINRYPQKVEIYRNDTNDLIYESKAIPVGSKIERAGLLPDLEAGEYECTAYFHNLDSVSGEPIGCAGAIIRITILN